MKAFASIPKNCHGMFAATVVLAALAGCGDTEPQTQPAGAPLNTETRVLEAGASLLQPDSPLDPMDVYLVGFHPMKDDPAHQMEAHHFCHQVNEDFAQCALFDGNTRGANLNGIEYIIAETLFNSLPEEEKQYWHPHNFEILSGQLVAPGIPALAENELMEGKLNSYGKTWHVWNSGSAEQAGDALPLGEAMLAWSFNREGEAREELVRQRDERMQIDSTAKREDRAYMREMTRPQAGVDALRAQFPDAVPMEGVSDSMAPDNSAPAPAE